MTLRTQPIKHKEKIPWNLADWMVISQTVLPAMLYLPGVQPIRVFLRLGQYGMALAILVYVYQMSGKKSQIPQQPSVFWLLLAFGYTALMLVHPTTNSVISGLAHLVMSASIAAPVLWTWAFVKSPGHLNRLLWLLLIGNGINCFVGFMQVRDPGFWLPKEFSSVYRDEDSLNALIYEGVGGKAIVRPPGLSDAPGAVCGAGVFAVCAGIIFAVSKKTWRKPIALAFAFLGAAAIFYSLVRSAALIAVGMVIIYMILQALRGRAVVALSITGLLVGVVAAAYFYTLIAGGEAISERFGSLFEEDPATVYYENRGNQVEFGFAEQLPHYPFGAGLGRYGMINYYFGDPGSLNAPQIWVEIQWNAWVIDGGFILLLLYPIAIFVSFHEQIKIAFTHPDQEVRELACIVVAINSAAAALCFSYIVFMSPGGIQFWFLSGAIHSVAYNTGSQGKFQKIKKVLFNPQATVSDAHPDEVTPNPSQVRISG